PVTVEAETPLNEKIVTLVRTVRGREILVSRPSGTPGRSGGKAHIAVDAKSALLFDHASGERIGSKNVVSLRNGEAA
ncbi:MAG: ABC transporter ATP-binding protein, partial [Mesorhizobium sp.]